MDFTGRIISERLVGMGCALVALSSNDAGRKVKTTMMTKEQIAALAEKINLACSRGDWAAAERMQHHVRGAERREVDTECRRLAQDQRDAQRGILQYGK